MRGYIEVKLEGYYLEIEYDMDYPEFIIDSVQDVVRVGKVLDPEELLKHTPALRLLTESERLAIVPFRIRLH